MAVDITDLVAVHSHSAITTSSSDTGALMMPSHVRCTCMRENAEYMPSKLAVNMALWQNHAGADELDVAHAPTLPTSAPMP